MEKRLGVKLGETTSDGSLTVEQVFCLGNCALSPAVMLDGEPYGRVSPEVADFLIDDARRTPVSVRVYVPRDCAALSVGAEGVARAIANEASARHSDVTVVRNGSRGMFWLEPLVEVETPQRAHRLWPGFAGSGARACSTPDSWKARLMRSAWGRPKRFLI